jgi:DNA-binding CsgD family transcriptional regulator
MMRLHDYIQISQARDSDSFEALLVKLAHQMDFGIVSGVVAVERPGETPEKWISFGNTPAEWKRAASDLGSSQRDPVLRHLKRSSLPFVYDQQMYVDADAGDLWERAAPFGYRTGKAVALHLAHGRRFILGMDRSEPIPASDSTISRQLADLQLLAVYAADNAFALLADRDNPSAECPLSSRELECLKWSSMGKSAWDIGMILKVSEHTVKAHTRAANRKLDCANKVQAVTKAIRLGWIK